MNPGTWTALCVLLSNLWAIHDKWFPAALWLLGAIVMFLIGLAQNSARGMKVEGGSDDR